MGKRMAADADSDLAVKVAKLVADAHQSRRRSLFRPPVLTYETFVEMLDPTDEEVQHAFMMLLRATAVAGGPPQTVESKHQEQARQARIERVRQLDPTNDRAMQRRLDFARLLGALGGDSAETSSNPDDESENAVPAPRRAPLFAWRALRYRTAPDADPSAAADPSPAADPSVDVDVDASPPAVDDDVPRLRVWRGRLPPRTPLVSFPTGVPVFSHRRDDDDPTDHGTAGGSSTAAPPAPPAPPVDDSDASRRSGRVGTLGHAIALARARARAAATLADADAVRPPSVPGYVAPPPVPPSTAYVRPATLPGRIRSPPFLSDDDDDSDMA